MAIERPYFRTARQLADGSMRSGGNGLYVKDTRFARSPKYYLRSYLLLQKDLLELFDYIEPAERNLPTFSARIHALLIRACIEVEANLRAILTENGYLKNRRLTMADYRKIDASHRLSGFRVILPTWQGAGDARAPFEAWANQGSLPWYQRYNDAKHNRQDAFSNATFQDMLDAVCGCLVVLSAQFHLEDFETVSYLVTENGPGDGTEIAIGDYFRVAFPDWPVEDRYSILWEDLQRQEAPFSKYPYPE